MKNGLPVLGSTAITTTNNVTPLAVAAGIGWVAGVTYEWSEKDNLEAVRMCLDLGIDVDTRDGDGRTALHGAAHKGRNNGSRDTVNGALLGHGWLPLDYSEGLVRVGVQSAIAHPDTAALLRKLMAAKGIPIPPPLTSSVCITPVCK